MNNEIRVMTSGAFTAAHKELIPQVEHVTGKKVVTVTTSIGTGETSIPNRLKRGEVADVVIVAEGMLRQFIADGLVLEEGARTVASSVIGIAVRAGAPQPDIGSAEALKRTLLAAKWVAYSASVSGQYLTKSRLITGGERTGAVVARGDADLCCQQISELLPVPGIAHITPLPPELQKVSRFMAGVGANSPDKNVARAMIDFLASPAAAPAIKKSGLEPA
jgi:molybdate transport system substrate-binding protein